MMSFNTRKPGGKRQNGNHLAKTTCSQWTKAVQPGDLIQVLSGWMTSTITHPVFVNLRDYSKLDVATSGNREFIFISSEGTLGSEATSCFCC